MATVAVPAGSWEALTDAERSDLMHYAASLVGMMRSTPSKYSDPRGDESYAPAMQKRVNAMGASSWQIVVGPVAAEDGEGAQGVQQQTILASGRSSESRALLQPLAPEVLSEQLRGAGLVLESAWRRSNYDGVWTAVARKGFGRNEVSCLLESQSRVVVQRIELQAETYTARGPGPDMLDAFLAAAMAMCHEPGLEEAARAGYSWTSGNWSLSRQNHATGGGHDLTLRYR